MQKKITATTSSFRKIRENNLLYIDKTQAIYDVFRNYGDDYFFLARPRRFGKTLLTSTLKEFFEGNRELFKGLWIDSSDYSWEQHPVILLDFSLIDSSTPKELDKDLAVEIDQQATHFGVKTPKTARAQRKLISLVKELAKINKVVILIDEYDYPLVNNLHDSKIVEANRKILSDFFTSIKALDPYLHALFITGVSQIPKASIFSGLSNLNNLSLDPKVSTLLGYTKEELLTYFSKNIAQLAEHKNISFDEMLRDIQHWYNGYQFSEKEIKVYNPFSLHYLFTKNKFDNYWFQSGTPTFLLQLLKKNSYFLENYEGATATADVLNNLNLRDPQLIPLLFQTGYLTISSHNENTGIYTLTYPNYEVRESYSVALLAAVTSKDETTLRELALCMVEALRTNDMDLACQVLTTVFAHIPYHIDKRQEAHYHALFYMFIMPLNISSLHAEVPTNKGRIDMVVTTDHYIYIFEVKVDTSAAAALKQIKERRYYEQYLSDKKTVVLVGIAFNKKDGEATASCAHETIKKPLKRLKQL